MMASRSNSDGQIRYRPTVSGRDPPAHLRAVSVSEQCSDTDTPNERVVVLGRRVSAPREILQPLNESDVDAAASNRVQLPVEETDSDGKFNSAQLARIYTPRGRDLYSDGSPSDHDATAGTQLPPAGGERQSQAAKDSPESTAPAQPKRKLDIRKMTPYRIVKNACKKYRGCLAFLLSFLIIVQLFLVMEDSYISYGAVSEHSGCTCTMSFVWILVFAMRFYSRFVIPVAVSVVFWRQIMKRSLAGQPGANGKEECVTEHPFCAALEKREVAKMLHRFIELHWDPCILGQPQAEQLEQIQNHFDYKLVSMLCLAVVNPFILVFALLSFNVFELSSQPHFSATAILGILDVVSLGMVSMASGVMLSFYFIEVDMKKYVRCFKGMPGVPKRLADKARRVENCITDRWYPLEIGMRFSSVVYSFLLVISWASNTPLSCGFSVSKESLRETNFAPACWLTFVLVLGLGQLLTSSPLHPDIFGPAGLSSQVVVLVFLYKFAPTYEWSVLTHILYAVFPMCYLIWYNVVSIARQWVAVNSEKVNDNQTHVSRLASRTGFLLLIIVSLMVSVSTEYKHLFTKDQL